MRADSSLEALKQFVLQQTNLEEPNLLRADTDLFEAGLLDSLLAVSLVAFCEEHFGCQLELDEVTHENFSSLMKLSQLVGHKLKQQQK